ncbi:hypothetical protein GB937_009143 [Aspergillus fischeri]|nr:hypothetical protein GB937_009143 [Aspergillus fischeri]
MRARQDKSQFPAGLNDGEDILTYNGEGNRVTTVNCKDFCGGERTNATNIHQVSFMPNGSSEHQVS